MLSKSGRAALVLVLTVWLVFSFSPEEAAAGHASVLSNTIVYIQPPTQTGGLLHSSWWDPNSSTYDQYVWDNFALPSLYAITEIQWTGGFDPAYSGSGGPVIDFTVAIYASTAGGTEPDVVNPPLVEFRTGGNAGQTSVGVVGGVTMYDYKFTLPAPFQTSAGTKYWLQIEAWQHGIPDWGIAEGLLGNGSYFRRIHGDGDIYQILTGDAAFTLLASATPTCYTLTLSHTGQGSDPVATPANSTGCPTGQYLAGETISLSNAVPASGWQIGSWTGTNDDASTAGSNSVTMPASAHAVTVNYIVIPTTCYALTLGHTGQGSDLVATPANSTACISGQYTAGTIISLSGAVPAPGGQIQGWTGTDNNTSFASTNTITMPAGPHTATVNYLTVLLSPVGDIGASYNPTYRWNEVPGATWYYLWVNGPSGKVLDQWYRTADVCSAGACSATPATTLGGGAHRWWLQTWSSAGYGPWTAGMNFNAAMPNRPGKATLVSPSGSIAANNPTYTWNVSPDTGTEDPATWYYLYVSGPAGYVFTKWYRASDICSGGTCTVAGATPNLSAEEYAWWVQTWNSVGYGPWSTGMSFSPAPPGKATLVSPSGSIAANNPTYIWNAAANATWYYMYISNPSGYVFTKWYRASDVCHTGICSAAGATPNLGGGEYAWWVQTWNGAGYGPWSAGMHFNVP